MAMTEEALVRMAGAAIKVRTANGFVARGSIVFLGKRVGLQGKVPVASLPIVTRGR